MTMANASDVAPEPEPEPEAGPEPITEILLPNGEDPADEPIPVAEPIPVWSDAGRKATVFRDIHVYGFATVFLIIAIVCLVRLWKLRQLRRKRPVSALTFKAFLVGSTLVFCLLRSFVLYTVGYGSRDNLPELLGSLLWGIGFACLAAAFSLMLVILIETTQFQTSLSCSTLQGHILGISTAVYVVILVGTDAVLLYTTSIQVTLIVCRLFFILWGGLIMTGYFMVSWRINRNASFSSSAPSSDFRCRSDPLRRLSVLLSLCGFCGMTLMAIQVYATFDVLSDLVAAESPKPWPWLALQTSLRLLEAAMCTLLLLMSRDAERQQQMNEPSSMSKV